MVDSITSSVNSTLLICFAIFAVISLVLLWRRLHLKYWIKKVAHSKFLLKRHDNNPLMVPQSKHEWEDEAVFNPATIYHNGLIHMFYRAIGRAGVSVLGYAKSHDGFNFFKRNPKPVFQPYVGYGLPKPGKRIPEKKYNPVRNASGGGWSGCEDPRAVKIGNRIYVTYLAFGGWHSMRMAVTSISEDDLENENWNWSEPQFLSPAGEIHKNWVLFPEKINGKFAILHSVSPDIGIHYLDSLDEMEDCLRSTPPRGGRKGHWDNRMRGAGPPPIKTNAGWLLLYHANDDNDPGKYKVGAMILDLECPEKILYRSKYPILEPDAWYENAGKPGVVYASGAVIKDDNLIVYYGGADKVICVASVPLESVRKNLAQQEHAVVQPISKLQFA
jgi:predicted GH43/DUF377 family glycosyl hydrolase